MKERLKQRLIDLAFLVVVGSLLFGGIEIGWRLKEHHQLVEAILNTLKSAQRPPTPPAEQPPQ